MLSRLLVWLGAVFTVYGLVLAVMSNINTGTVLVILLGLVDLCTGAFYERIIKLTSKGFFKICKIIFIILLCIEFAFVSFLAIYGTTDTVDYREDAVIVLGAGVRGDKVTLPLKLRLDKAVDYHAENPDALIIVSGGQGFQETVTEAYAMEKYLVEQGVNPEIILKEEKASSTAENMKFSKEILDRHLSVDYNIAVVTSGFHVFRGMILAKNTGFQNVTHIHSGLQWYNVLPSYLRETLAVIKTLLLDL